MRNVTFLTLIVALLAAAPLIAADKAKAPEGFISLFDGKTLKGWTQRNGTAKYVVEDGVIVGTTNEGSPNSFLCSDKVYGDFELRFEVKVANELNSGVQIRSITKDDKPEERVNGPQVEIEASPGQAGYIYGEATKFGWLSPEPNSKDPNVNTHSYIKNNEWNEYRVIAQGPRIQTWINGNKVADLTHEEINKTHPKGFIGLQVHGIAKGTGPYQVRWRNLYLKDLSK